MHEHIEKYWGLSPSEHPIVTTHPDCVSFHHADSGYRTVEVKPGEFENLRVDGRGFALRLLPQHIPDVKALLHALESMVKPAVTEPMPEGW